MSFSYKLTRGPGYVIIVDDEDVWVLSKYLLGTMKTENAHTRYVVCRDRVTRKYIGLLHRILTNAPDEMIVDHKNGNGLDCQRHNMRVCNHSQNQHNRRTTTGKARGVHYRKDRGKWLARITVNKRIIHLGFFLTEDEAVAVRLIAEQTYFGEYNGSGTAQ